MLRRCAVIVAAVALHAVVAGSAQAQHAVGVSVTITDALVADHVAWQLYTDGESIGLRGTRTREVSGSRVVEQAWLEAATGAAVPATAASAPTGAAAWRPRVGAGAQQLLHGRSEILVVARATRMTGTRQLVLTRVVASNS